MQARTNRSFSLITLLFCLLIFTVPVFWALRGNNPQGFSLIENRNLQQFNPKDYALSRVVGSLLRKNFASARESFRGLFTDRSDQVRIEQAASDQFPLRIDMIKAARALDRAFIDLAYFSAPDPAIPTDMHSEFLVLPGDTAIIFSPARYGPAEQAQIDQRIDNYRTLIAQYPRINFYAYHMDRLPYSPLNPLNPQVPNADGGRSLAYFEQHLPTGLSFAKMDLQSLDEHLQYYYRTDHHWNIHGVILAYNQIYDLLKQNYPDISPRLDLAQVVSFPGADFLGRTAAISFYPIAPDQFEGLLVDLPPYRIFESGTEITGVFNLSQNYHAGDYSTEPYYYHYGKYFGTISGFVEYVSANSSTRNLMLLGDSNKEPLHALLAAHYRRTYMINMREYPGDFNLVDFLADHPVDDILLVGDNHILFMDPYSAIDP